MSMREVDATCAAIARDLQRGAILPARLESLAECVSSPSLRSALGAAAKHLGEGETPAQALRRTGAFPEAYLVAMEAGRPQMISAIAAAASAERRYLAVARRVALRALVMLGVVLVAVGLGVRLGVPALVRVLEEAEGAASGLLRGSFLALEWIAGPVGLLALVLAVIAARRRPERVVWMPRRAWLDAPRAVALRAFAQLVEAGLSAERALHAVSGIVNDGKLREALVRSGRLVEQGAPAGEALAATEVCDDLRWAWRDGGGGGGDGGDAAVALTASAMADVFEARAVVSEARLDERGRATYVILGGALVLWAGLTLLRAMWEVMVWLAFT